MAEGAPLLRAYRRNPIEGSNPSLSARYKSARLCRAFLYLVGRVGEKPRGSKAATAAQMAQRATRQGEEFGSAKF